MAKTMKNHVDTVKYVLFSNPFRINTPLHMPNHEMIELAQQQQCDNYSCKSDKEENANYN